MAANRVSDMSLDDLRAFVEAIIKERLGQGHAITYQQQSSRSVDDVLTSMRANLWTPPPNTPSSLEMLREDRDR